MFRFRRLRYCGKQQKLLEDFKKLAVPCGTKREFRLEARCDGKGPTVTIIRVGRYIFGGYTSVSWGKWTL